MRDYAEDRRRPGWGAPAPLEEARREGAYPVYAREAAVVRRAVRARSRREHAVLAVLAAVCVGALLAGAGVGAVGISPARIGQILLGLPAAAAARGTDAVILLQIRLPRVLVAGVTGASLAVAGALFQALFRNPLADPYILGASSGASLGAVVAIALALNLHLFGWGAVPLLAFAGALGTVWLVYRLARACTGRPSVLALILAGVAVGSFLSALVSLIIYLLQDDRMHQAVFWMMGGFSGATWDQLAMAAPYLVGGLAVAIWLARDLDSLLLGEETAQHLGVRVEWTRRLVLSVGAFLTAVAVASGGVIGFVGLVVPHAVRMLGGPNHRYLVPASALGGAGLMILADLVARSLMAPMELPVGVVTALTGAPFFLYLLQARRSHRWM